MNTIHYSGGSLYSKPSSFLDQKSTTQFRQQESNEKFYRRLSAINLYISLISLFLNFL